MKPGRAQMRETRGDHYGPELREADAVHAEKLAAEEMRQRGWKEAELRLRRKGDPRRWR